MQTNTAALLGVGEERVNLKARTAERLGPVGEGRAVECHVVLTLVKL